MKELPQRSTRGKRMNDLLGEEKDYDHIFWGQEIFKETISDDEYETESEKEDNFDEDFFHVESSEDETQEPKLERPERSERKEKQFSKPEKPSKKKKKKLKIDKVPGITQKEMLEQAAIVEMYNTHDLTKLLSLEENSKVNLIAKREKFNATWRYKDTMKNGKRKVTIWHSEDLDYFPGNKVPRKKPGRVPGQKGQGVGIGKKKICAVTGLIARYTDPLTGKHFANNEAFRKIREEFYEKQEKANKMMIQATKNK
ncbi:hypothetical protein SteCoe_4629 [Stentor coeruleus]|uniref:Vps72/YL1 C-terminal domain-containing protein n=1 Tax=Stentor coeruleus TaxID=5963 RepID=A0A1R2CUB8_9CILI|nr:hypothetical protein SteCoe_4629 [Stentor coeruleus]